MKKVEESKVYTFSVNMIVQVIAEEEAVAKDKLDREGGYITTREVELLNTAVLHNTPKEKK
jgi:hypothetical protein